MAENDEALSHPEYWDERYSKADGEAPTHEWFRSFGDLEEFFQKVLFQSAGRTPDDKPLILHLGSGDSVCDILVPLLVLSRTFRWLYH